MMFYKNVKEEISYSEYYTYCESNPVRENKWGDLKDTHNRVGKYLDQYEML